jgi:hypothetical protein
MEALAEGSAAVDASPEPLEDLPAEEPPSLGTGDDSATDSGVEPAAAGAAVATGPAVDAGPASILEQAPPAAATEGPSIFEITPCQDVIDGQQQQEHEEMPHTDNPAAAAAAVEGHLKGSAPAEGAAAAAVTPYNKLFAEISSQLNQSVHSQLQEEGEDAKTAVHLQLQPPAAAAEAAYVKVVDAGAITLTNPQDDYADCCMGVAAAMDPSVPTAEAAAAAAAPRAPSSRPQSPLHSSSSSSSRRQAGFKARAVTLKAVLQVNRQLLLTSVLPAAAGAVLAIAGSCSLAQARRLRRQQQVLLAAMATASATAAAADGDDDGEQPSVPAGEVAGGRVRGMVVYRGTARRICSL